MFRTICVGLIVTIAATVSAAAEDVDPEKFVWGINQNGLQAGGRILGKTEGLAPGDPVVVEFVLRNTSSEKKTLDIQQYDSNHPVFGSNGRIELNISGSSQKRVRHQIEPGEILAERAHRVSFDTTGLPVGQYRVTANSAFWIQAAPNQGTGIRFGKSIPFSIGIAAEKTLSQPKSEEDQSRKIYWGKPVSGLIAGARIVDAKSNWKDGEDMVAELFVHNSTDNEITVEYEIPPVASYWNLHLVTKDQQTVMLDSIWYTGRDSDFRRTISLKPGEQLPITGITTQVMKDNKPIEMKIESPMVRLLKEKTKFNYGDPKRLIAGRGEYFFNVAVTMHRTDIPDLTLVVSAGAVPFVVNESP